MTATASALPGPRLLRVVGRLGLAAIAVNGVVGSGIFVLPADVARLMGTASPTAYVLAALLTLLVVACFAEAGSLYDRTGGPYLYAREAFGPFVGFQVGWMFLLTRLAATAAIANAFVDYAGYFWPAAARGGGRLATLTAVIAVLAVVNFVGVRYGAWTVNFLTAAKLVPLLLFVGAGFVLTDPGRSAVAAPAELGALRQASLLLIFAFGGFENASVPGAEAKDPRRHLPLALLGAVGFTTVLYVLIQVVALRALPDLGGEPAPLASAARAFLGPAGGAFMTAGAVLSTAGSMSALMLVGPRILFAFAEGGQRPAVLARVHPRFRTPAWSLLAFALAAWVAALAGDFAQLARASAIARLVFSAATCLAVPVLRRRLPDAPRSFALPGGWLVPGAAVLLSLWLLTGVTGSQAWTGVGALALGGLIYLVTGPAASPGGSRLPPPGGDA